MAALPEKIEIRVDVKIGISWLDALKFRVAGGKYMKVFWETAAANIVIKHDEERG